MDYQQTETIELRKVKPESDVVFQCGRNTLERKTINREQNDLIDVLRRDNYKSTITSCMHAKADGLLSRTL